MKLQRGFFARDPKTVAREILGKILIRNLNNKRLKAKIIETEAYYGEKDPASRAYKGKNKISEMMWREPGKILVYTVHSYKMLNFITGKKDEPSAVLIRALEPLNFSARCSGPGLLSSSLRIDKSFHGEDITLDPRIKILNNKEKHQIAASSRIGVTKDLKQPLRFFIQGNSNLCLSK